MFWNIFYHPGFSQLRLNPLWGWQGYWVPANGRISLSWVQINSHHGASICAAVSCLMCCWVNAGQKVHFGGRGGEELLIMLSPYFEHHTWTSHSFINICSLSFLLSRMAQWGAIFSIIVALTGAGLLASMHKIDEGYTGVYYRWVCRAFGCSMSAKQLTCLSVKQPSASNLFAKDILNIFSKAWKSHVTNAQLWYGFDSFQGWTFE